MCTNLYQSIYTNIYQSIIQPYFDYCAQVWGCLGKTLAVKVQKLQNRAFRIITRENYTTRSADILKMLWTPNLEKRRMQQLSIFMYKVKNRLVPDYLCDLFTNVSDIHNYDTRQSGADLILPKPKTNSMKNAFSYRGAEAWNTLFSVSKIIKNSCQFFRLIGHTNIKNYIFVFIFLKILVNILCT